MYFLDFSLEVVSKSQSEIEIQLTMLNSSATIQSIDSIECAKESDGTACPNSPNVLISGSNANLPFDFLGIGESYRFSVSSIVYTLNGANQMDSAEVSLESCTGNCTNLGTVSILGTETEICAKEIRQVKETQLRTGKIGDLKINHGK